MGFSVKCGAMLAGLLATAACGGQQPATTTFVSQPQVDPFAGAQRTSTPIPGTAWVVACLAFPNLPPERRQSCRADLNLAQPGQAVQANLYTLHGGRHWMLRTNLPATGLSIQVEGRPNSHVGRCSGAGICVLEDAMPLTQEIQAGSRMSVTLMTARGGVRSQVPTAGITEALRLAAAGTSPAALGDRPTLTVR